MNSNGISQTVFGSIVTPYVETMEHAYMRELSSKLSFIKVRFVELPKTLTMSDDALELLGVTRGFIRHCCIRYSEMIFESTSSRWTDF